MPESGDAMTTCATCAYMSPVQKGLEETLLCKLQGATVRPFWGAPTREDFGCRYWTSGTVERKCCGHRKRRTPSYEPPYPWREKDQP